MLKFNQYELYVTLFKVIKKIYLGNLYLVIESITFDFDQDEPNEVMGLLPWGYTVKGRYGREEQENPDCDFKLHEEFNLTVDFDDSLDVVAGKFERIVQGF